MKVLIIVMFSVSDECRKCVNRFEGQRPRWWLHSPDSGVLDKQGTSEEQERSGTNNYVGGKIQGPPHVSSMGVYRAVRERKDTCRFLELTRANIGNVGQHTFNFSVSINVDLCSAVS